MRLINERTLLVMELKTRTVESLGVLQDELAQLFLEVYNAWEEDQCTRKSNYQRILAVLSDKFTWHIFVIN